MSTLRSLAGSMAVALGCAAALAGCAATPAPVVVGRGAPDASFALPEGGELRLAATRGKVVVLAFFTTYCPTSPAILQAVGELRAKDDAAGLRIIAVDEGDSASAAFDFANKHNVRLDVALDTGGAAANQMGLVTVPSVVVIDRQGTVRHVHAGYHGDDDRVAIYREVSALLVRD